MKKKGVIWAIISLILLLMSYGGYYWFSNPYLAVEGHYTSKEHGDIDIKKSGQIDWTSTYERGFGAISMQFWSGQLDPVKCNTEYKAELKNPTRKNVYSEGELTIKPGINKLYIRDSKGVTREYMKGFPKTE